MEAERTWPLGGYAPGGYMCHCLNCKAEFTGDKRAVTCLECAVRQAASTIETLRKQNQELRAAQSLPGSDAKSAAGDAEPSGWRPTRQFKSWSTGVEHTGAFKGDQNAAVVVGCLEDARSFVRWAIDFNAVAAISSAKPSERGDSRDAIDPPSLHASLQKAGERDG